MHRKCDLSVLVLEASSAAPQQGCPCAVLRTCSYSDWHLCTPLAAEVDGLQAREHLRAAEQQETRVPQPTDHWDDEEGGRDCRDCESVLTTLSNLDNHPGTILEPTLSRHQRNGLQSKIQLSAKTGLPIRPSNQQAEHKEPRASGQESSQQADLHSSQQLQSQHRRGETTEERRARKASVKEARVRLACSHYEHAVMRCEAVVTSTPALAGCSEC